MTYGIVALAGRCNNYELDQFRWALQRVYGGRVYYEHKADDFDHLKAVRKGIEETDKSSRGEFRGRIVNLYVGILIIIWGT